ALIALVDAAGIAGPVRDALDYLGAELGLPVSEGVRARLSRLSTASADDRRYDQLTRPHESWSATDVLTSRWDEYAAGQERPSVRRLLGFPAFFFAASAHYRGRPLTPADLKRRITADWRRLLSSLPGATTLSAGRGDRGAPRGPDDIRDP